MRVAMMSWRDMDNPEAGGAERYLTTVAHGLVDRGHEVTLLTAAYPGAPALEHASGVTIRRAGGKLTVYPAASLALARGRLGQVDVVVDVQNGVPFFSRLVTRAPVVLLVHHVHREQWPVVYGPAAAALGWWVESRLSPLVYRSSRYVTVSGHTRDDLVRLGVDENRIAIVHNGTDEVSTRVPPSATPRLVTLGRLVPHKRVEQAMRLVHRLRPRVPDVHLDIVGDGWWREELHRVREQLALRDVVTFHGHVSEQEKDALLGRAWVHVLPSLKEGWGLSVVEAAAHGVPTVGYRAAGGLADSIEDGRTGLLVDDEDGLRAAVLGLLSDSARRTTMGGQARDRARQFTWDETVGSFEKLLIEVVTSHNRPTGDAEGRPR
jgi:glycosyltransferase involved in cell wall biosynthesis